MSMHSPKEPFMMESSNASASEGISTSAKSESEGVSPMDINQQPQLAPLNAAADPYASLAFPDALEEVHTRFILNLPDSELQTADRIFFQIEQAWWFYEDLICDKHPELNLPRFQSMRPFAEKLFAYSPLLPDPSKFNTMWNEFSKYKRKISNYGCILLNAEMTKMVLCRVWNGRSYTFPSGKINQGEDGPTAAGRETYEETGFDLHCKLGLTAMWKETLPDRITGWQPIQESDALTVADDDGKQRTLYVVAGVPEDFPFEPVTRKEVSEIGWYPIDQAPKQSYAVNPFLPQLRKWIKSKSGRSKTPSTPARDRSAPKSREGGRKKSTPKKSRNSSRGRVVKGENDDLVMSGLAIEGDVGGWSEEDMFQANEKLIGRKIEYDGNPHFFAEQGFGGVDPHAFRVVGGGFLNRDANSPHEAAALAPPPDRSKLQPLFRSEDADTGETELQPFFSTDGTTPWGELVEGAQGSTSSTQPRTKEKRSKKTPKGNSVVAESKEAVDTAFIMIPTDLEITAKSQTAKKGSKRAMNREKYVRDMEAIRAWVDLLPKPQPTRHYGEFKLDADAILAQVSTSRHNR